MIDTPRFAGRVALITGGGTGIGRAVAVRLAREGASVALGGLEAGPLEQTAREVVGAGGSASWQVVDVGDAGPVSAWVDKVGRDHGRIDIVVNSAGTSAVGPLAETAESDWDRVFDTNVKGIFLVTRAALAWMGTGGTIVNLASQLGISAVADFAAYAASKAAVIHLTRSVALEAIRDGIRVNCVCPGAVDTPLLQSAFPGGVGPQGTLEDLARAHPIGRIGTPDEIASVVAFLASDEARFMVGSVVVADGGYVLP